MAITISLNWFIIQVTHFMELFLGATIRSYLYLPFQMPTWQQWALLGYFVVVYRNHFSSFSHHKVNNSTSKNPILNMIFGIFRNPHRPDKKWLWKQNDWSATLCCWNSGGNKIKCQVSFLILTGRISLVLFFLFFRLEFHLLVQVCTRGQCVFCQQCNLHCVCAAACIS